MYILYFDGSNKGDCYGCGAAIIYEGQKKIFSKAITLVDQPMSCNVAEYQGLITGLEWFLQNKKEKEEIFVFGDSKMVINQMFSHWRIKNGLYRDKALQAKKLASRFSSLEGQWIPREENVEADKLSKKYPKKNQQHGEQKTTHSQAYEEHQQRLSYLLAD